MTTTASKKLREGERAKNLQPFTLKLNKDVKHITFSHVSVAQESEYAGQNSGGAKSVTEYFRDKNCYL